MAKASKTTKAVATLDIDVVVREFVVSAVELYDGYTYAAGYLASKMGRVLAMLPDDVREREIIMLMRSTESLKFALAKQA